MDEREETVERERDRPLMVEARFHPKTRQVFVSLDNGAVIAFPAAAIAGLIGADEDAAGTIAIVDDGHVLEWPEIGLHVSYLSILTDVLGARAHIARLAGSPGQWAQDKARRAAPAGRIGTVKRPRR